MFRKSLIKVKQRLIEATRWPPARLRNAMPEPQKGAGTFAGAFCQAYSATCLHSNATDDGRSGLEHSPSTPRFRLVPPAHCISDSFCNMVLFYSSLRQTPSANMPRNETKQVGHVPLCLGLQSLSRRVSTTYDIIVNLLLCI